MFGKTNGRNERLEAQLDWLQRNSGYNASDIKWESLTIQSDGKYRITVFERNSKGLHYRIQGAFLTREVVFETSEPLPE